MTKILFRTIVIDGNVAGDVVGNNNDIPACPVLSWPPANLLAPNNNTIIVNRGGKVSASVFGAYDASIGYDRNSAKVSRNTVTIDGGQVIGNIYGGYAQFSTATHNTVNISGQPQFTATSVFYGGYAAGGGEARNGNTLNLHSPVTVQAAQNFENWNFFLPLSLGDGGNMLTVTGTAALGDKAKVKVVIESGCRLQVGDSVNLIKAGKLDGELDNTTGQSEGSLGAIPGYEFVLNITKGFLVARVTKVDANKSAISGNYIPDLALPIQAAGLIAAQSYVGTHESLTGSLQMKCEI